MNILITGWAWFVWSNITKVLLEKWNKIISIDNFVLWQKKYINEFLENKNYIFIEEDLLNIEKIIPYFNNIDLVIHLAANSDISKWAKITNIDLNIWTIVTYNVLEAMRLNNVKKIIFASSSAIYWIAEKIPTKENDWPLLPISLYWASKLACEWLVSSFCHNYWIKSWIYRFWNVIWRNSTHWAAYDFVHKLKENPSKLLILWNWKQKKPYIYIDDLINWILLWFEKSNDEVNYFNLSTIWNSNVDYIAECIINHIWLKDVTIEYTWWSQWWKWDVPEVELSTSKINSIWWNPKYSSDEAVFFWTKDIVEQNYFKKQI
jgi:UDP-glucose 4-epimerase